MHPARGNHRHTSRRHRRWPYVLLVLVFGLAGFNFFRPLPPATANVLQVTSEQGSVTINWPAHGLSAVGAKGFGVLASSQQDQKKESIASVAKVITSLTILDKAPLKPGEQGVVYTVTQADVDLYNKYAAEDGSVVRVTVGEQITEYQALTAMLLPSANNIADSMAIWNFGSMANYLTAANAYLQKNGLANTVAATDASGFEPGSVSTAVDLVKLGELATNSRILAQITSQSTASIPLGGAIGQVQNVNVLLGTDGINGIKTGNTDQAGGCFLFSADYTLPTGEKITIIAAILHATDLPTALHSATPLLDSVKPYFEKATPVQKGEVFANYTTPWGTSAKVVAQTDISIVAWDGLPLSPTFSLKPGKRQVRRDQQVGVVTMNSGGNTATTPLVLQSTPGGPGFWWRLTRHS